MVFCDLSVVISSLYFWTCAVLDTEEDVVAAAGVVDLREVVGRLVALVFSF